MRNLFELIIKNFKLLFRNKASTFIFILGPMAVVLLLGMAFNTADIYGLKLGVYSKSYNNLSNDLLTKLSEQFTITKAESAQQCIDGVKLSDWHVCLIFPEDFKITGNNTIDFYVNPTKMNLVYIITNMLSAKVSKETEEISTMLVETILQKINSIKSEIEKDEPLVEDIKSDINTVKDSVTKISGDISALDVSLNESDFRVTKIEDEITLIRQEILKINKANENVSEPYHAMIQEAYENIIVNVSALDSDISNLSSAVNLTSAKMKKVAELQGSANTDLSSASLQLSQSIQKISSLQDSIKIIKEQVAISVSTATVVKPINTTIREVTSERRYTGFVFPLLIVLLLMFGGIFFGSILVISEKTSRAYFRNLVLPVRRITFILASYITTIIILLVEVAIVLGVAYFFTKTPVSPSLILLIFIVGTVFVFIGLMVGYFSKTTEMAMLISIALVALLLFFSNIILPIEAIAYLKEVAMYNPFTIATNVVKENILLNISVELQERYLLLLFCYLAIIFVATVLAERYSKSRA